MKKTLVTSLTIVAGLSLLTACTDASDLFGEEETTEVVVSETTTSSETTTTTTAETSSSVETRQSTDELGTEVASGLDIEAIANLDFSSVEGTYDAEGGDFIISGQTISFDKEDGVFPTDARTGMVEDGVAKVITNSATYYFIPAGVARPTEIPEFFAEEDVNKDRVIVSGNGMNLFYLDSND